jgi:Flp pilus assembly protein TadD
MMTGAIGRLLRLAAVAAVAGLAVGCASPQGPASVTAPAGYGKDSASRVERLVQYCDRLAQKGELVTALGLCARAHEIDPDNPEPLMKVATILQALNRDQAAAETYGALLERHPKHHEARYRLGKLHMEAGEAGLATMHFDRATQSDPQDPRPYNALGILRDQAGEHEAAQGLYRLALERDPANFSVRNNLGLSLALDGKRDEAIEVLAELAVDPQAGQTVLRNLEAAYASRTLPQPGAAELTAPVAPLEPLADPVEPVASEPLESPATEPGQPPADAATMTAPDTRPGAPEAEAPTPLYPPPAAKSEMPQQSGARQPEASPAGPAGSAILAAAEQLMQPPEWADFEPGALLGAGPPEEAAVAPPPESGAVWSGSVGAFDLGTPVPAGYSLSMLVLDSGTLSA